MLGGCRSRSGLLAALLGLGCTPGEATPSPLASSQQELTQIATIEPPDNPGVSFGRSMTMVGPHVYVGQPDEQRVLYFEESGGSYAFVGSAAPDVSSDEFGQAVAANDTHLIVGSVESNLDRGRMHVFSRSGSTFTQTETIEGDFPDQLGRDLVLDGTTLAAGASDGTHIFDFSAATLDETQVIAEAIGEPALDGDVLAVASASETNFPAGVVRVYRRDGGGQFQFEQNLLSDLTGDSTRFGRAVAVQGDTILVTQQRNDRLFEFTHQAGTWTQTDEVQALAGSPFPGTTIGFGGELAVFGNSNQAATLFAKDSDGWRAQGTLAPTRVAVFSSDLLGLSPFRSSSTSTPGQVFVFTGLDRTRTGSGCTSDDDCLSGHCTDGVCCTAACDGACQGCSSAEGATEDGSCTNLRPQGCCVGNVDCENDEECRDEECVPLCQSDPECDDQDPCTTDTCTPGGCSNIPDGSCGAGGSAGSSSGGATGAGGVPGTGGAGNASGAGASAGSSTAGSGTAGSSTAGSSSEGGNGNGGSPSVGGSSASGGGATAGTGGSTAPATSSSSSDEGGCGCHVVNEQDRLQWVWLFGFGAWMFRRRFDRGQGRNT